MTTASTSRPTLVVDIGGTLLERASSPVADTVHWLRARGVDVPGMVDRVKAIVHTAPTTGAAEDAIASAYSLAAADRAELTARWRAPAVRASPRAGAVELLQAAVDLGWHVCAASTCVAWAPHLPAEVERYLGEVVTSYELAITKDEPSFWTALVAKVGCDPALTMVVGDDAIADDAIPAGVGLTTWPCPADGGPDLVALRVALVAAGPMPSDAAAVCAARAERWRDRDVLVVRSLAPFVSTVTRCQVDILTTAPPQRGRIVRRKPPKPPVLVADVVAVPLAWIRPVADRRSVTPPSDLARALQAHSLVLDELPLRERRHLISMVREAKDSATRAERINDVMTWISDRVRATR